MRFLCLHGLGTNSQIFETQTAAIRYDLGDKHIYDFVEGTIPCKMAPEFESVASATDRFFCYADFDDLPSCLAALDQLDTYVQEEGPFDGLMAFSQGATIAATYLANKSRYNEPSPFKCAVLFSAGGVFDVELLKKGVVSPLTAETAGEIIRIPTAHIWGVNDSMVESGTVSAVCEAGKREVYVHDGGHEIPAVRSPVQVKACVRVLRRVISIAASEEK
ncbi:serine hydrolase FSH [Triangularia verruculosa]|uniref:Serine hydrolase FSH n=1 Tax=Triangularia verruculosa TaxID=2587418 RepID=A0AAN6XHN4_9PEZI|nr:serine hydrolase FSH [Triangularia verruculosa]